MSQFWIDVYNAADVKQNAHTQVVSNVRITDRISQIGECEFTLPATVATQIGAAFGMKYRLYHETLGDLGKYTHYDSTTSADEVTVTIKCYDSLVELANIVAGFGRNFTDQSFTAIAAALLNVFGVSRVFETGFDQTQILPAIEFQGESVLRALDSLRQYVRGFFRRNSDTVMAFGDFSATTPVFRLYSPALAYAATSDYATITELKRERRGTGVVNRVFPFGAGIGETVVDLRYSTRTTPYTIQNNAIYGTDNIVYYITDAASVTAYGNVDRTLSFTEVRPLTNSAADLENAANVVYDLAVAYMQKAKDPIDAYSLSCINLPLTVRVGDLIRVDYSGVATLEDRSVAWLTLDNQKYFITEITRDFGDSGEPTATLTVSTNGEEITGTTEVFSSLVGDVGNLKLRVQPSMSLLREASPTLPMSPILPAELQFYIGPEVLALNEMKVEFTLMPLRSFTSSTGATDTANSSNPAVVATGTPSDPGTGLPSTNTTDTTAVVTSGGGSHSHSTGISSGVLISDDAVYFRVGDQRLYSVVNGAVDSSTEVHSHTTDPHSHTFDHIHTHSHTHPIPHTHGIEYGIEDAPLDLVGVSVKINGDTVGDIINLATGVNVGGTCAGPGLFQVDILSTLLAQGDFREQRHVVQFLCVGNYGQIFAQVKGRVTIQPIGVS